MITTLNEALIAAAKTEKGIYFTNSLDDEEFCSYADFLETAKQYLAVFQNQGVRQGDELVLQFDSLHGFLYAYWACLLGGIIPIPLAFAEVADHTQKVLKVWPVLNSPRLATDASDVYKKMVLHAQSFEDQSANDGADAVNYFREQIFPRSFVVNDYLKSTLDSPILAEMKPDDIAFIQFSSGSTGTPKGVTLTHNNLLVNIRDMLTSFDCNSDDVFLSWKPKSHDFGMIGFHLTPVVGCVNQVHIPTKVYIWSPAIWFQLVDKHRASILGSPNFGYQHFLKLYKRRRTESWDWDLSCVKTIINGAEPISPDLCERFCDEMKQYRMHPGVMRPAYGLAEASLIVSICNFNDGIIEYCVDREHLNMGDRYVELPASHPNAVSLVDCGIPYPSTPVRITNEKGHEVADGVIGKVEIRGGNVTAGYYNNPEASKKSIAKDGWLNTEDLGFKHNGRLVFASRIKEMIIINGINYFPYDIERAILRVKGEAALNQFIACSIPHPKQQGEKLAVFVYYKKDSADFLPVIDEVRDIILDSFGLHVDYVVPTGKIPKTTSGKVQRFRLSQQFLEGEFDEALAETGQRREFVNKIDGQAFAPVVSPSPVESSGEQTKRAAVKQRIRELVMREAKVSHLTDDQSFFALGIPSIRLIGIQDQIENEFDVTLSSVTALDNASVNQLTDCIMAASTAHGAQSAPAPLEQRPLPNSAEPIAIIGVACRFPGGADTPEAYWELLRKGVDPVKPIPADRWQFDPQKDLPISCREGGFLTDIDKFDPLFFGITPKEAEAMDPQQRLLLEVCNESFENAGLDIASLKGSNTGVFVGMSTAEYAQVARDVGHDTGPYSSTGNMFNTAAGRISYVFGLEGPSIAIDSACSSSLVCMHQAVQALQSGSCDKVVVGAVNLILKPDGHISYSQLNALSPTGRCRSFDEAADGYIRSEGCGAVVLKRFVDAERDGDNILAVIRGSSINHNGNNGGLTVPSATAQERMIRRTLHQAGVSANDIDYLEAHGSGTKLGDPQEASALSKVFAGRERPLLLGSVKSNLGHLEAAAGMAGLIKVVLSLKHGQIPPNLHLTTPNSLVDWNTAPLQIVDCLTAWPQGTAKTAAITSLGINGSNAHMVLQAYEPVHIGMSSKGRSTASQASPGPYLFTLSAKSEAGLLNGLAEMAKLLPSVADEQKFYEWCRASNIQRSANPARYVCMAESASALQTKLSRHMEKQPGDASGLTVVLPAVKPGEVAFLYTGQGSVYPRIALRLYQQSRVYRAAFDECERLFEAALNVRLSSLAYGDTTAFNDTAFTQALIFSVEYSLTQLWKSLGVKPGCVLGHSIGEYVAATEAGVMDLESAITMVTKRGQIMQKSTSVGKMAGILASREQVESLCHEVGDVWIAAVNSPENVTISGRAEAVDRVVEAAKKARIFTESLPIHHAFHSPLMSESADQLAQCLAQVEFRSPKTTLYSSLTGAEVRSAGDIDANYWRNHLCRPVLFADAFQRAVDAGVKYFIEIGGNATLCGLAAEMLTDPIALFAPTLREGKDDWVQFNESLGLLYKAGAKINWQAYHDQGQAEPATGTSGTLRFPNTAYNRQRYWFEPNTAGQRAVAQSAPVPIAAIARETSSIAMAQPSAAEPQGLPVAPLPAAHLPTAHLPTAQIAHAVQTMLADISGLGDGELDANTHLLSLGLDSLMFVQLGRRILAQYAVDVSLNEFFKSLHTPDLLAAYVWANMPEEQRELLKPQTQPKAASQPNYSALNADPVADSNLAVPHASQIPDAINTPAVAPASDAIVNLMQSQLAVMQQQIQLLGGHGVTQSNPPSQAHSQGHASQPGIAATLRPTSQLPVPQTPRLEPLIWGEDDLTPRQREFIQGLASDINRKTQGSKNYAENYSDNFADWLVRAHFMSATKDMGHLVVAESAKGSRFKDINGNEYIDTCLGFTTNLFGHNPDFVVTAISEQLQKGMILGPQSDKAGEVARMICELTGAERVAFANSGTEAVMASLRVARAVTGRRKIARFTTSYHGTFDGVLAQATEEGTAPLAVGVIQSMVDDTLVFKYGAEKSLERVREHGHELAAVLVEPVQSRNLALQPVEFLRKLRALTEELGIALIFDEVIFGFRCHPGGVQKRFGIQADLVTYGKVVGGGMPIGVIAGKAKFMDAIDGGDWMSNSSNAAMPKIQTTFFAGTFCKHPLAMAAAHAVLTFLKADGGALQKRLDHLTDAFVEQVNSFFREQEVPYIMRNFSSVYRFDPLPSVEPDKLGLESDLFFRLMLQKGIYVCYVWENRSGSFSAAHTPDDVQQIIAAIKYATFALRDGGFSFRAIKIDPPPARKNGLPDGETAAHGVSTTFLSGPELPSSALSSEERRMFVLSKVKGGDLAYRICGALEVVGEFDLMRMRQALSVLVARHRVLRTAYHVDAASVNRRVMDSIDIPLAVQSLGDSTEQEALTPDATPLNLTQAPLWRIRAIQCPDRQGVKRHLLLLEFSHLIFDGISFSLFVQELIAAYHGDGLPTVTTEYEAYVARELAFRSSEKAARQLDYWSVQLQPVPAPLDLPADYPRPAQKDFAGDVHTFVLDETFTASVRAASRNYHCTPFTLLFTAYFVLLSKLSRQGDVCVGVPVDARGSGGFDQTLGMFAQSLAIRTNVEPELSFGQLVAQVSDRCNQAYDNSQLPLDHLIETLDLPRDLSRNALFDVMFIYELGDERSVARDGLTLTSLPLEVKASAFDLTLEITLERGRMTCRMIYASSVYAPETVAQWSQFYTHIVTQVLTQPELSVAHIDVIDESERQRLLFDFNNSHRAFNLEQNLIDLFNVAAATTPKHHALVTPAGEMTYADLERCTNHLAHHLKQLGAGPGQYVGIMLPREQALIVAMLAVMKTGAAYVPIDPEYPKAQVAYMLEKSTASLLVSKAELCASLTFAGTVVDADLILAETAGKRAKAINEASAQLPAYSIFTSGSTGQPKGVVVGHRSLVNFVLSMSELLEFPDQAVSLGLTSVSFDIFVLEVFVTLARSGTLALATEAQQRDPKALVAWMKHNKVNVAQMTASRLQVILATMPIVEAFAGVQRLLIGGEAFPQQHLAALQAVAGLRIFNVYGPTETTVWSSIKELTSAARVTLGKPIANTRFYVLDAQLDLLPTGCKGDLYIAGSGLALSYLNDPERTDAAFVPDPFFPNERMYRTGDVAAWVDGGELAYFGRSDNQVKLRGYRIELAGIEAALMSCDGITNAAVVVREQTAGNPVLVAFCTCAGALTYLGDGELVGHLQSLIRHKFPEYMVPGIVVRLQELPLTPNSKVDRKRLPQDIQPYLTALETLRESAEKTSGLGHVSSQGATDGDLAGSDQLMVNLRQIWRTLLGERPIPGDKSFFDVGGNSMSLVLMQNAIEQHYPGLVEVTDIFANPTLKALHKLIAARRADAFDSHEFTELVMPEDFFTATGNSGEENSLLLHWDETAKANIAAYAHNHGVAPYDVVLAMHGLLLHKLLQQDSITLYSASENGYSNITLDFTSLANTGELVQRVHALRLSANAKPASPGSDRQHNNGVLTLFVHSQESTRAHPGFDLIFNINHEGTAERLDFDGSRLCGRRITDLAGGYINLVKTAVANS